jgi:hypothetical protein
MLQENEPSDHDHEMMSVTSVCSEQTHLRTAPNASTADSPSQPLAGPKSSPGAGGKGEEKSNAPPAGEKPKLSRAERREIQERQVFLLCADV